MRVSCVEKRGMLWILAASHAHEALCSFTVVVLEPAESPAQNTEQSADDVLWDYPGRPRRTSETLSRECMGVHHEDCRKSRT